MTFASKKPLGTGHHTLTDLKVVPITTDSRRNVYIIHIFQSRDQLEDLEGKTSIKLQDKPVNFPYVSQPQIFRSPQKNKTNACEQNARFVHVLSI